MARSGDALGATSVTRLFPSRRDFRERRAVRAGGSAPGAPSRLRLKNGSRLVIACPAAYSCTVRHDSQACQAHAAQASTTLGCLHAGGELETSHRCAAL